MELSEKSLSVLRKAKGNEIILGRLSKAGCKLVYSTSWYKEVEKKEYKGSYIPSINKRSTKTFQDPNHSLYEAKQACLRLKRIGEAMEKGDVSHVKGNKIIFSKKY